MGGGKLNGVCSVGGKVTKTVNCSVTSGGRYLVGGPDVVLLKDTS